MAEIQLCSACKDTRADGGDQKQASVLVSL